MFVYWHKEIMILKFIIQKHSVTQTEHCTVLIARMPSEYKHVICERNKEKPVYSTVIQVDD